MNDKSKEQVRLLRFNGLGYRKIATELGISVDSVKAYCRTAGLTSKEMDGQPVCPECGKKLVQPENAKTIRFCSDTCRVAWWNKHRSVSIKSSEIVVCAHCGNQFIALASEKRKYCCHDCYIADRFKGSTDKKIPIPKTQQSEDIEIQQLRAEHDDKYTPESLEKLRSAEMDFRLCKILVDTLFEQGLIYAEERVAIIETLAKKLNPPIGILEVGRNR